MKYLYKRRGSNSQNVNMKFELPRRHRKSFEAIAKKKMDENLNKEET